MVAGLLSSLLYGVKAWDAQIFVAFRFCSPSSLW
jgi:hypothetical protein